MLGVSPPAYQPPFPSALQPPSPRHSSRLFLEPLGHSRPSPREEKKKSGAISSKTNEPRVRESEPAGKESGKGGALTKRKGRAEARPKKNKGREGGSPTKKKSKLGHDPAVPAAPGHL